jgi:hypothetical protein
MRRDSLLVDAFLAVKWLVEEPGSDAADALRGADFAAPASRIRRMASRAPGDRLVSAGISGRIEAMQTTERTLPECAEVSSRVVRSRRTGRIVSTTFW